jgi:hypothetical protein
MSRKLPATWRKTHTEELIIARHYGLPSVTMKQAQDEVASLRRKWDAGSLDDMDLRLYSALNLGA